MPTYGSEYGAVLPWNNQSPMQTYLQLRQYKDQQARYDEAKKRQEQERQDQLTHWAADQLDIKNFATGTPLDNTIISTLQSGIKDLAGRIAANPDMSSASLLYDAASIAGNVNLYSQKAKAIRANAEAQVKEFAKNPSVDAGKLLRVALASAFMKPDPNTHAMVIKDPSEIDDQKDYVTPMLGSVIKGDDALYQRIDKAPTIPYENEWTIDKNGVKRQVAYKGKISPLFHNLVDDKGALVDGQNTPATGLAVKSTPVTIGGKQLNGVTDEVLDYFTSDPFANANLNNDVRAYQQFYPDADPDDIKRVLLNDKLTNYTKGYINRTKNVVDASQLQSENHSREMKYLSEAIKSGRQPGNDNTEWNNLYKQIDDFASTRKEGMGAPLNQLPAQAQSILIKYANDIKGKPDGIPLTQADIFVQKEDGKLYIKNAKDGSVIAPLTRTDANIPANSGLKQKEKALHDAKPKNIEDLRSKYKY